MSTRVHVASSLLYVTVESTHSLSSSCAAASLTCVPLNFLLVCCLPAPTHGVPGGCEAGDAKPLHLLGAPARRHPHRGLSIATVVANNTFLA
jgi:hypothetical protein